MNELEIMHSASSTISNCQDTSSIILAMHKHNIDTISNNVQDHDNTCQDNTATQPSLLPPTPSRWPGTFDLFSFPREIRDCIYFYYLYRLNGISYRHPTGVYRRYCYPRIKTTTNLFLVSKQVYQEALEALCRYVQLDIGYPHRREREIKGVLRLFPDKPATLLQRVIKSYYIRTPEYYKGNRAYQSSPTKVFIQILQDACTLKSYFPKLREFTAIWRVDMKFFNDHGFSFHDNGLCFVDKTEEETIQVWLTWMRRVVKGMSLVPPGWLVLEVGRSASGKAMDKAYKMLVKEAAVLEDRQAELEDSGRRWIEEVWDEGKRRRRSRRESEEHM